HVGTVGHAIEPVAAELRRPLHDPFGRGSYWRASGRGLDEEGNNLAGRLVLQVELNLVGGVYRETCKHPFPGIHGQIRDFDLRRAATPAPPLPPGISFREIAGAVVVDALSGADLGHGGVPIYPVTVEADPGRGAKLESGGNRRNRRNCGRIGRGYLP